jgi:pimeloyl-ACP methyl ester carboxylesterase
MRSLSCIPLLAGLVVLAVSVLPAAPAKGQGAKKADTKSISFKAHDGAELQGTLYPNSSGRRDAVVLLLHDFSHKSGGSSQVDNLPNLARSLQDDGYVVLTFDFRGFGESKNVDKNKFWKFSYNRLIKGSVKAPETIDHKDFQRAYYPYLVNDIAAAKAYLDRLNDQKQCNTSSLIVIGAGQGATLGAMWIANECRRKKDKNSGSGVLMPILLDDEPESRDIACAVWLTISPALEGRNVGGNLRRWVVEAAQTNKIPMGFAYGKSDGNADTLNNGLVKAIKGSGKVKVRASVASIPGTSLAGSKLLERSLGTEGIIKKYLSGVMETRGSKEHRDREVARKAFYYAGTKKGGGVRKLNKAPGDEAPPVDVGQFLAGGF